MEELGTALFQLKTRKADQLTEILFEIFDEGCVERRGSVRRMEECSDCPCP